MYSFIIPLATGYTTPCVNKKVFKNQRLYLCIFILYLPYFILIMKNTDDQDLEERESSSLQVVTRRGCLDRFELINHLNYTEREEFIKLICLDF